MTLAELHDLIDSLVPDNHSRAISPASVRTILHDVVGNEQVTAGQILTTSGVPSSSTVLFGDNTWKAPSGALSITGTGDPGLTRAQAIAATFTSPPNAIRTIGRDTAGDGGEAFYIKVGSTPSHSAYFTTADGSIYEMFPEHGELNFMAYGTHQPMADYRTQPTIGGSQDCYASWVIADHHIAAKNYEGINLRLPAGKSLFTSTPFQIRRIRYNIIASGTGHLCNSVSFLRTPIGSDAIIIGHHLGTGHDYNAWTASTAMALGAGTYNVGNFYRVVTSGTTGASSPPTGTGASIVDGTVHWAYEGPVGDYDTSTTTTGGDGAIIENVIVWSFWRPTIDPWPDQNLNLGGLPIYNCGFLTRTRATFRNCIGLQYNGHGIAVIGSGDAEIYGAGNADAWRVEDCATYYNGKDGLHVGTMNANAGSCYNLDTANNGRWGINDSSLLGNLYEMHQTAYDGSAVATVCQYPNSVLHNGYFWYARLYRIGIDSVPNYHLEPGTVPLIWIRGFGDGTSPNGSGGANYPDWNNTQIYEPGGAFCTHYGVAVNTWMHSYVEGGTKLAQPNQLDLLIPGVNEPTAIEERAATFLDRQTFRGPVRSTTRFASNSGDKFFSVTVGTDPTTWATGVVPPAYLWRVGDWEGSGYNFRGVANAADGLSGIDYLMNDSWGFTGHLSTKIWNRSQANVAVPDTFISQGRLLATGNLSGGGAYALFEGVAAAIPTSGNWQEGDKLYAISPHTLGWAGWICTVGGNPGTWKTFGQLGP